MRGEPPAGDKDLVFIVSGGRTGTMFFGRTLSRMIEDCYSVHEPDVKYGWRQAGTWRNIATFGLWHMVIGRALGLTGAMATARQWRADTLGHDAAVRRTRAGRRRFHANRAEPLIVEANAQWVSMLPVLRDAFPRARIVCISREQDSWVGSWLRRGTRHTARDSVNPRKRVTPVTIGDPEWAPRWPAMTAEDRLRWEWRFVEDNMRAFVETDGLSRLFRFEDIFDPAGAEFREMMKFVTSHDDRTYACEIRADLFGERINATARGSS